MTAACLTWSDFCLFYQKHSLLENKNALSLMQLSLHILHSTINSNVPPKKAKGLCVCWYCDSFHLLCSWYAHFSCSNSEPRELKGNSVGGMSNVWVKSQVQTWPLTICVLTRGEVVCLLSFHFTCLLKPVEQSAPEGLNLVERQEDRADERELDWQDHGLFPAVGL